MTVSVEIRQNKAILIVEIDELLVKLLGCLIRPKKPRIFISNPNIRISSVSK